MSPRRPPDPFRPGEVEEGRPFAKLGRPSVAAVVALAIVVALVLLLVVAAVR